MADKVKCNCAHAPVVEITYPVVGTLKLLDQRGLLHAPPLQALHAGCCPAFLARGVNGIIFPCPAREWKQHGHIVHCDKPWTIGEEGSGPPIPAAEPIMSFFKPFTRINVPEDATVHAVAVSTALDKRCREDGNGTFDTEFYSGAQGFAERR